MAAEEHRFDTEEQFLAYLAARNPDNAADEPAHWDRAVAMHKAKRLCLKFQTEFGSGICFDGKVCDATYHAGISLPPSVGIEPPGCEIRLSNFSHLAAITWEEGVTEPILSRIIDLLRHDGYTYVPFRLFGEPFIKRQRCNGDLFAQLFDHT